MSVRKKINLVPHKTDFILVFLSFLSFLTIFLLLLTCHIFRNEFNTSHIALFVIVSYFALTCVRNFFYFLKYLFLFAWSVHCLTGIYICENFNFYMNEMFCESGYAGSLPLACIFFEFFFFILFHADKHFQKKIKWSDTEHFNWGSVTSCSRNMILMFLILCFIVNFLLFLSVIKRPAFLLGIDRFDYAAFYLSAFLKNIFDNLQFVFFTMIAMYATLSPIKFVPRIVYIFLFSIPFFLFAIWTGNKFGIFFDFICYAIIPICAIFQNSDQLKLENQRKKFISSLLFCFCIIIPFLSLTLYLQFKNSSSSFDLSIRDRIAQQGQLWWKIFQQEYDKSNHLNELKDEFFPVRDAILTNFFGKDLRKRERSGIFLDTEHPYGVYKLMQMTIPNAHYYSRLNGDSGYSSQGFELPFYYFKSVGTILCLVFFAFIIALLVNQFAYFCFIGKIFLSIIFLRLLAAFRDAFFSGGWSGMFTQKLVLSEILLFILYFIFFLQKNAERHHGNLGVRI